MCCLKLEQLSPLGPSPLAMALALEQASRKDRRVRSKELSDYLPRPHFIGCSHVVIATFEPLCGKETVEVLGWQKHVFAVCG